MITVRAATEKYGIGRYTLLRLVYKGVVRGEKQAGTIWLINERDVEEFLSLVPLGRIAGSGPGRTRAHYHLAKLPASEVKVIQGRYYLTPKGADALKALLRGNEP
jgi:excisionase family DNA binding protein